MKVLLLNGSPRKNGCTNRALTEIEKTLQEEGVESEIFHIGSNSISPCRACRACAKLKKCVIEDDRVNEFVEKAKDFDGFIIGSPVYYAAAAGGLVSFLNRAFFQVSMSNNREVFLRKPAAAIVSARRAGTSATLDQLNKYFTITQMPIISGRYWNQVHGQTPEDVEKDLEGLQNLRILSRNFAYYLKCIEAGKKLGIEPPKQEETIYTNFINE